MAKTPKTPKSEKTDPEMDKLNISMDDPAPAPAQEAAPAQDANAQAEQAAAPMINVLVQYVKDMSFENPNAPDSLRSGLPQPEVAIDLRIGREINADNQIEVSILMKAHATREGKTAFIAELDYAGLFAIQNVGLEQVQPLMMIECPRILFPYARKILADMTQDGGFPPVMLDMPDFAAMFREEMMRRAQEQGIN